ncbi:MAG: hypothetical protein IKX54_05960 [Lachnospiraceae bacterium]|nr:hypothetical protein [Lachnospiraceae bacterium]
MSIESRLAAKKRSLKARKKAKIKSAMELALIILIPVVILVVVFLVLDYMQSKINDYSKYITKQGTIEDYDISKEITLPDLDNMGITYDTFLPTDTAIESRIVSEIKTAVKGEDEDDETEEQIKAKYLAKFTDANVEEFFGEMLGDKYAHTTDGYRQYIKDLLQKSNYNNTLDTKIREYLNNGTTFNSLPKKFVKNWVQISTNEAKEYFESFKEYYGVSSVYELYGGKKEFKKAMEASAEDTVKSYLLYLAVYEKLGLSYTQEGLDKYINEHFVTESKSREDAVELYGEPYLLMGYKIHMATDALKEKVPAPEASDEEKKAE